MFKREESYKKYHLVKLIGKGCYSRVYKAKSKSDNKIYSIKIIQFSKMSEKNKKRTLCEIRILNSINHPQILKFEEAFTNPKKQELWIVTEYLEEGDLSNFIERKKKAKKKIKKKTIWKIGVQILLGLIELNKLKIIHRDIKPANLFLNKKSIIKIGDFNISKIIKKKKFCNTQIGTPYYLAPEIWRKDNYTETCDIFSFGIILYELLFLKHPFLSKSKLELKEKILTKKIRVPKNDLGFIIAKCLTKNPENRPNAEKLLSNFVFQSKISKYSLNVLITNHKKISGNNLTEKIELKKDFNLLNIFLPKKKLKNLKKKKIPTLTYRKRFNSSYSNNVEDFFKLRKSLNTFKENDNLKNFDSENYSIYDKLSNNSGIIDPLAIKVTQFSKNLLASKKTTSNVSKKTMKKSNLKIKNGFSDYCSLYDNKENQNNVLPIKKDTGYMINKYPRRKSSYTYSNISLKKKRLSKQKIKI